MSVETRRLQYIALAFALCLMAATESVAATYTLGDVFASVGNGKVAEYTPAGTLVQVLNSTTNATEMTGSAFDSAGNFYVTGFGTSTLSKFDNSGNLLSANFIAGNNPTNNESIVFSQAGNFFVGGAGGNVIREFAGAGTLLSTFTVAVGPRGTDWIDLAADQRTLFYTSEGGAIRRFDTVTNTQLTDFANVGGVSFALRLLPGGGALVAHSTNVLRLDATGAVVQTYTIPGSTTLFALNLDPDGTSFWTGNIDSTGKVFHVRISDGAILGSFNTVAPASGFDLAGLSIFGEITQGCAPNCPGQNVPEPASMVLLGTGVAALALMLRRKA